MAPSKKTTHGGNTTSYDVLNTNHGQLPPTHSGNTTSHDVVNTNHGVKVTKTSVPPRLGQEEQLAMTVVVEQLRTILDNMLASLPCKGEPILPFPPMDRQTPLSLMARRPKT
ncbi:hypothetical protein Acr_17g0000700 [Actinidia rufa]|uniref:Uncharacterized protein n=1 Tax=Actinidia rufa TaxID=165716 RepID=A0A7J0G161_9ERIC|nr:hypothetical protein Acr_17g0000700 [Actinidia rufa]